jgi:hypothetical protein
MLFPLYNNKKPRNKHSLCSTHCPPVHVDVLSQPRPGVVPDACSSSRLAPRHHKETAQQCLQSAAPVHTTSFPQPQPPAAVRNTGSWTHRFANTTSYASAMQHSAAPVHVDVLSQPHPGVVPDARSSSVVLLTHSHLHLTHQQPDGRQRLGRGVPGTLLAATRRAADHKITLQGVSRTCQSETNGPTNRQASLTAAGSQQGTKCQSNSGWGKPRNDKESRCRPRRHHAGRQSPCTISTLQQTGCIRTRRTDLHKPT